MEKVQLQETATDTAEVVDRVASCDLLERRVIQRGLKWLCCGCQTELSTWDKSVFDAVLAGVGVSAECQQCGTSQKLSRRRILSGAAASVVPMIRPNQRRR